MGVQRPTPNTQHPTPNTPMLNAAPCVCEPQKSARLRANRNRPQGRAEWMKTKILKASKSSTRSLVP
jgi:hypothetical protein